MYTGIFTFTSTEKVYVTGDNEADMTAYLKLIDEGHQHLETVDEDSQNFYFLKNVVKFEYYKTSELQNSEIMGLDQVKLAK